jgi:dTDP-4-dehydrorhamnose reductase
MGSIEIRRQSGSLQLWGGVECTINRVGDRYIEQLNRSGHTARLSDFEEFARLGIKAIRQPILWERTAPSGPLSVNWDWTDLALGRLRELQIRPIAGLVHHGSGPEHTGLLDKDFSSLLENYAAAVARRYPWLDDYTPVNEPLTTARFSGLYGHWYPHGRDDLTFARALLTECRATVMGIRAIRKINPQARLIQTEDLGKVFSTPALEYQAAFENERRWLSYDLLFGRVDRIHPMWSYLTWVGIEPDELEWFRDNPCPPAVLGVNHYLSGERYLDEHLERYPSATYGGNGKMRYADVLAARVRQKGAAGPFSLLMEGWARYGVPLAVTECHNGCTREEQLRWFLEVWRAAESARSEGADVLAVTAWSLLGAFDWDHLVTKDASHYEPGVFDLRSTPPRPTAIAHLLRSLSSTGDFGHPLLEVPGWWRRPERYVYGISIDDSGESHRAVKCESQFPEVRPLLIVGGSTTLSGAFARSCKSRGIPYRVEVRSPVDSDETRAMLLRHNPWAVIYADAHDEESSGKIVVFGRARHRAQAASLAQECDLMAARLMIFSNDLVFDGQSGRPYLETDPIGPLSRVGINNAGLEAEVAKFSSVLIIRCGPLFGQMQEYDFVAAAVQHLAAHRPVLAEDASLFSPAYVPHLIDASLDLLIDGETGFWHLANQCSGISWAGLAKRAAQLAGVSPRLLCLGYGQPYSAERRGYYVLGTVRGALMPSLEEALTRYASDLQADISSAVLAA